MPNALPPKKEPKIEPFEVIQFNVAAVVIVRDSESEVSEIRRIEIPVLQKDFSLKLSDLVSVALRQAQNPQQNQPVGVG
jgi:hypothetical protein